MKKAFIVFLFVIGTLTLLAYFNNNATAKTTQEETFALLNLITAIIAYQICMFMSAERNLQA